MFYKILPTRQRQADASAVAPEAGKSTDLEDQAQTQAAGQQSMPVPDDDMNNSLHTTEEQLTNNTETPAEKWRRRRILTVYLVTTTILYADLALMAPNLSEIADEFGFDDDERDVKLGGYMALGFFSLSFPVALLIGWLADFCNRSPLYAATVLLGEAACLGTYFVETYPQLFVMRLLTGVSISGALPVIFSVLGDLYPPSQRNAVAAIVTTGTGLGTGVGQALAGFLGPTHGWRFPFLVVSIPGILCSFLLLCIRDPPRGRKETARIELDEAISRKKELQMRALQSNVDCVADSSPGDQSTRAALDRSDCMLNEVDSEQEEKDEECGNKGLDVSGKGQDSEQTEANAVLHVVPYQNKDEGNDQTSTWSECGSNSHGSVDTIPEAEQEEGKVSWKTTKEMLTTPTVALVFLGAAPGALPFGFGSVFLNDYLAEDRGMTVEEATGVLATFGAGNALGVISSGVLGHYAYRRDIRLPPVIMGVSLILSCVPMFFLINWVNGESSVAAVASVALLAGFFSVVPVPIERAILTNVTVPNSRGRANSLLGIIDDLGKGLGPALVSVLIQAFDRPTAFNVSLLGWVIGGITSFAMVCFVPRDEEKVQERVREYVIREEGLTEADLPDRRNEEIGGSTNTLLEPVHS